MGLDIKAIKSIPLQIESYFQNIYLFIESSENKNYIVKWYIIFMHIVEVLVKFIFST
jgi:hypothetical protein